MIPQNSATVLLALGYEPLEDFTVRIDGDDVSLTWTHADPEPTEQQLNDYATDTINLPSGQSFSDWLAENGGDTTLTRRREAIDGFDDHVVTIGQLRAVIVELIDYVNTTRGQLNTIGVRYSNLTNYLGTLAGVTIPTNAKINDLSQLPIATKAQAITAVKDRITSGEAD